MAFTSGSLAAGPCCGLDPGCDWGGRNAGVSTEGVMPLKSARMMTQGKKKKKSVVKMTRKLCVH